MKRQTRVARVKAMRNIKREIPDDKEQKFPHIRPVLLTNIHMKTCRMRTWKGAEVLTKILIITT